MRLLIRNVDTLVSMVEHPDELTWLTTYLKWTDPKARHSPLYKMKMWDGTQTVFEASRNTFPSGLVALVHKAAVKAGHKVQLLDARDTPMVSSLRPIPEGWLRDYQEEVVDACIKNGRGIVQAPTASGKTRCFSALAWTIPAKWLVLVDTKDLLDQGATMYQQLTGEVPGRVGDGQWTESRVTFATSQTLQEHFSSHRTQDLLKHIQGVICDEVHCSGAEGFQKVLSQTTSAYWRFGFSATPLGREDCKDLLVVGQFGPIIHKVEAAGLMDQGRLARPEIYFLQYGKESHDFWRGVEILKSRDRLKEAWQLAYRIGVVENIKRNTVVVATVRDCPKPALVFVRSLVHGGYLQKQLQLAGMKSAYVHGKDDRQVRKEAIQHLERGDLDVVVCSTIFNKGIDIPELRSLVNAAGGRSAIQAIQKLGRGTRAVAGKNCVKMYDFLDNGPWLESHARIRVKTYQKMGFPVEIR